MNSYQQIHDFTPQGAARFAEFLAEHARPDVSADACRMECLGVIEDNLNGTLAGSMDWELGQYESATSKPATFTAEPGDLIIESVDPTE